MSAARDPRLAEPGDFWSRRRAAVEAEARAAEALRLKAEADAARAAIEARQEGQTDAEILAGLGLKDPGSMVMGDDFAAFLRAEVPERLRRQALRQLWRSNPVLANLDGLVDHGDDFSDAATVRADMRTAYQVGRGIVHAVLALADAATGDDPAVEAPLPAGVPEAACVVPQAAAEDCTGTGAGPEPAAEPEPFAEPAARPPRHMRFVFAG